jgi:hypothetical protein
MATMVGTNGPFHIILDERYTVSVYKRGGRIQIGIYKVDSGGKRRGVALPHNLWEKLVTTDRDILDLAIDLVGGTTAA